MTDPFKGDWKVGGRLDLKVGRVIHVENHIWDKNRFYFEYIEVGDRVSNVFVSQSFTVKLDPSSAHTMGNVYGGLNQIS